jgi:uncharacterized repeat protein (TIGR03803 family)
LSVGPQIAAPQSVTSGSASLHVKDLLERQPRPNAAIFAHLYSFKGVTGDDGAVPVADLTDVKGTLYGTTLHGGAGRNTGTVFKITTSGSETVLHSFGSFYYDPAYPDGGLKAVKGTLYGTTEVGGGGGNVGTVFKISTSGAGYRSLYTFQGGSDGRYPSGDLIDLNGLLYGTTCSGGITSCGSGGGCGTVFSVSTSGAETVVHRFAGIPDGAQPLAALLAVNGTLYGTTELGGSASCNTFNEGCGTVFKIGASGTESVLYSFKGGTDGTFPTAGLIALNGTLYGTTKGNGSGCGGYGCGTVFEIGTSGTENVLYNFKGGSDGAAPAAGLTAMKGTLYGTTSAGGGSGCGGNGCGTVFAISTSGAETVLHSFSGGSDGAAPAAGLTAMKGTLYGTTSVGGRGCRHRGCGTVFALTP